MQNRATATGRLALNFVILSGGELVCKALTFAAFAYLARVLRPDSFGIVEFALAIIFVFNLLVDCGSSQYGAVQVARDKSAVSYLASRIAAVRCLLALGAYAALAILIFLVDKPWPVERLVLLYGLSLFGTPGLLQWVFQGRDQMQWVAAASMLRQSVFAAGVFLFVRGPEQAWAVALVEVIAVASAVAFSVRIFRHYFGPLRLKFEAGFARSLLRQSLPICLSQTMMAFKLYLPTIILGMLAANREVGWFGAAHRIVFALNAFGWLYLFNLLPSIARHSGGKPEGLRRLMQTSIKVTAWSAIFVGSIGTALAAPLVSLVYGPQYSEASRILQVMIWLIAITMLGGHYRYLLIGLGKQELDFLSTAAGAATSLFLNLILIPRYGPLGAAWSMLLSEAVTWSLAYYFVRRKVALIPMLRHLSKPALAGAAVLATLHLLPMFNFWLGGGAALAIYALALLFLQPGILTDLRALASPPAVKLGD